MGCPLEPQNKWRVSWQSKPEHTGPRPIIIDVNLLAVVATVLNNPITATMAVVAANPTPPLPSLWPKIAVLVTIRVIIVMWHRPPEWPASRTATFAPMTSYGLLSK